MPSKKRYPALYERLSHDDEIQGDSNSISNQKRILEDYAQQNGMNDFVHFTDDGFSGTRFDRPGFQAMIREIEADNISVVVIKDMSRFGRDYLQVGAYTELLGQHNTRLIALNDGVDTLRSDDEFIPFRNIMNEWYAKDTSKKIRSAYQAKNLAGKHTSSAVPYGYLKSPENKDKWIIDPVAAPIVRRIFQMTVDGFVPYRISQILSQEKVEIPAYHHQKLGIGLWKTRKIPDPYHWCSTTIVHILENPCYLGHTCNFKTRKQFKDKKSHYVAQDQWVIIKNTQEAIIDQDTYDIVQHVRGNTRCYPNGYGDAHPLSGLVYCADCGSIMYVHRTANGKRNPYFTCSAYGKVPVGSKCPSSHRIYANSVLTSIQETLRQLIQFSKEDEAAFIKMINNVLDAQQSSDITQKKARLTICKNRLEELDLLICRIYEDNILGKMTEERYQQLEAQYEKEQADLEAEITDLDTQISVYENGHKSVDKFIDLIRRYQNFEVLTPPMIKEFIYKIFVHEREIKYIQKSPQTIEIYFNFIGKLETSKNEVSLSPEEIKLAQHREHIRVLQHKQYLRRKESGWQDAYYQKTRAAKKAVLDARKEKIHQEDKSNGIFYIPNETNPQGKGEAPCS